MILVGNQRGGARDLALHLMKDENERVVLHELRGFASDDLISAFQESQAISQGTRCNQHLYSLSLNPPREASVAPEVFEDAVDRAEERLGLASQPRAIVFHEKRGRDGEMRRHAHAVWCRIDPENMRAVNLPHTHRKLQDLARELYIEHGWQMPAGFVRSQDVDPRNYSLAEWQQAKRAEKDPRQLKTMFQGCWAISDSQAGFAHALKERGYILARGNRRGVVAVDREGEVYAISRWVGIKAKQVFGRISELDALPDVDTARTAAAWMVSDRLRELRAEQADAAQTEAQGLAEASARLRASQEAARRRLQETHQVRQQAESKQREARFRRGWRGLIDRITGRRKQIEAENRTEAKAAHQRDEREFETLAKDHKAARKELVARIEAARTRRREILRELDTDIERLERVETQLEKPRVSEEGAAERNLKSERRRQRRKRDGPELRR